MPKPIRIARIVTAALLLASAPALAMDASIDPAWPQWMQDSIQRESTKLKMAPVATNDSGYRFTLPDTATEPEFDELGWKMLIDIGTDTPVDCYLATDEMPMATLLVETGEAALGLLLKQYGYEQENMRSLHFLDAGAIDGSVYLALEWLIVLGDEDNTYVSQVKVRAATDGEITQVCSHAELGYRESFERIFTTFVQSTDYALESAAPFSEEISVERINGQANSATYIGMSRLETGEIEVYSYSAAIYPVSASEIQYSDWYYVSNSIPGGYVVDEYTTQIENGEVMVDLSLYREHGETGGDWVVDGQFQGTDLDLRIDGAQELQSDLTILEETRLLFAGDGETMETKIWLPSLDPANFTLMSFTRDDEQVPMQGILSMGPMQMTTVVDEFGSAYKGHMQIGPNRVDFERVWSRGAPIVNEE